MPSSISAADPRSDPLRLLITAQRVEVFRETKDAGSQNGDAPAVHHRDETQV